jgi:hypothetical protein
MYSTTLAMYEVLKNDCLGNSSVTGSGGNTGIAVVNIENKRIGNSVYVLVREEI